MEGIAETNLRVGVRQIAAGGGTVTINLEREGLEKIGEVLTNLEPENDDILNVISSLIVDDTELQRDVSVLAIDDNVYTDDRRTMLILTANNYTMKTVVVNITDDDERTIGLNIGDATELDLPQFARSQITVSAEIDASLTVETEGEVSLAGDISSMTYSLTGGVSTQIEIVSVDNLGTGIVTFTASAARATEEMKVLNVNVIPAQLGISARGVDDVLRIEARMTTELTVDVSIPGDGRVTDVTVTATIDGDLGVARLSQTEWLGVSESTVLTVEGLNAGDVTLRLTASHPDYDDANTDVTVNVFFPPVRLNVSLSPSEFEEETISTLMVEVIDNTQATITIRSDNPGIASVPSEPFILQGGTGIIESIVVTGNSAGDTTLMIEAEADGYALGIARVRVDVLDRFRIEAEPDSLRLVEGGDSTQISVSLSRIRVGENVTVTINSEGTGLAEDQSFTLSSIGPEIVTVEVVDDENYDGDRSGTLTLTADRYAPETVTVNIMEDEQQPIGLSVPIQLSIVTFERIAIEVSVDTLASLTIRAEGAVILVDDEGTPTPSTQTINIGQGSQLIEIRGESVGDGTVIFTAQNRLLTETATVSVTVTTPALVISEVSARVINLATQATTVVAVSVRAEAGTPEVMLTASIDEANVAEVSLLDRTDVGADTMARFRVTGLNVADDAVLTLTAEYPGYDSASTTVDVNVSLRQIGLSVDPSPLVIVTEIPEQLTVGVSADTDVTLTVTVDSSGENIISGFVNEYSLSGEMSVEINVNGDKVGTETLTIRAEAVGYETETTSVSVEVLDSLRIRAKPDRFDLREGESTQISVSLNLIRDNVTTVTINIREPGSGFLDVTPSSLMFNRMELSQTVTVTATNDDEYTGDRTETLILFPASTTDNYMTEQIQVDITEDDLQPIGLRVVGATELSLVTFETADITVSVDVATDLTVNAEGAVSLVSDVARYDLTGDALSQQIQIEAVSVGEGIVTFTVGGARQLRSTAVVTVMVSTPTLTISASVDELEIEAPQTADLTVTVNVAAGDIDTDNVTVTTTVTGNTNAVSVESPVGVSVGIPTIFTVRGLDAGDATLRLTADHPDYKPASIDVSVSVSLPPIGLSVDPSVLRFVIGGPPEELTITALPTATTITISVDGDAANIIGETGNIINMSPIIYMLDGDNSEVVVRVRGDEIGRTTLTITAEADGYETERATVGVEVLDSLRIEVDPDMLSLMEDGVGKEIRVRPNLIRGDVSTVTINIDAPEDLTVSASSLEFTNAVFQTVTVTAEGDEFYTGNRSSTLTLTPDADDYTPVTVPVTITDDELPPIGLDVRPSTLVIVTGMSTELRISVATTATITITGGDNIASVLEATFILKGGEVNSMRIPVSGGEVGTTTLMITAEEVGYETETTSVSVEVLDILRIQVNQNRFNLTEGGTQAINVNLNRIDAGRGEVEVMIVPEGGGLRLTMSTPVLTFDSTTESQTITVEVEDDSVYEDVRTGTVTLMADGYASVTVTVEITDNDPRPPRIDLSVMPAVLDLVISEIAEVTVSVEIDASLVIGPIPFEVVDLIDPDNGSRARFIGFNLSAGTSTRIAIVGVSKGMGTVAVTANESGDGTGVPEEIRTVTVTVSTPTLVITEVSPPDINLVTRDTMVVTVSVRAEAGAPSDVMLIAMIDEDSRVAEVSLLDRTNIGADTTARFIVGGLNVAGNTTLTLTARHPLYEPASIEVPVNVSLRPIELSVTPTSVRFEQGETELLIITALPTATTITISVDGDAANIIGETGNIINMSPIIYMLDGDNSEVVVRVRGDEIGRTTLTITAEADGYETERATVGVEVLDSFRIEAMPDMLDLTENTQIRVKLSRIEADNVIVRVTIQPEGSGLTVSDSSLVFTGMETRTVSIIVGDDYSDGAATVTFMAEGYEAATVNITAAALRFRIKVFLEGAAQ